LQSSYKTGIILEALMRACILVCWRVTTKRTKRR